MEFEIHPPIELNNGALADSIGAAAAGLHKMQYKRDYERQGYNNVSTRYTKEVSADGKTMVRLFVDIS